MTSYPPTYSVGPPPADPTAVMGRRIAAWILDFVLWAAVLGGLWAAQAEYVEVPSSLTTEEACAQLEADHGDAVGACIPFEDRVYIISDEEAGLQTVASLGYLVFFIVLQGAAGGSPGKLILGLRVVTPEGRKAGVGRSFVRTLLWIVDGAPWFAPLVGLITGLTTNGHRRVGDMAAGTHVVSASSVGSPVVTPSQAPPGASWGAPAQPGPPPSMWDPQPTGPPSPQLSGPPSWAPPTAEPPTAGPPPSGTTQPLSPTFSPPQTPPSGESDRGNDDGGFVAPDAPDAPRVSEPTSRDASAPAEYPPPQWDAARNTYIQWDPGRRAWLQWDQVGNRWKPIDS